MPTGRTSKSKRHRLAHQRKAMGFSQEGLAERLEVDRSTVARWESGETDPQPWARPRLAEALRISLQQLVELLEVSDSSPNSATLRPTQESDLLTNRTRLHESDDMNRRELLRLMTMAGTLVAVVGLDHDLDWERLGDFSDGNRRVDHQTVNEYAALNDHLWHVFTLAKTRRQTYPFVQEQLDVLINALRRSQDGGVHRKLCALVSDLSQLAGEILFDGNRYTDAAHCYTLAATAGKEAGAYDLWACALTRHAFIGVYEREYVNALPMLDLAAHLAKHGDPNLSTRYWVSAVRAQAAAGLGDLSACQFALDHAEHVHQLKGQLHTGGWLRFDGTRLPEERGACYVTLRRADLAQRALDRALRMELSERRRGGVLTDLAALELQHGDIDQLVDHAGAAMAIARATGSGWVERKLANLHLQLAPLLGNRRVRQLSQELASMTTLAT